MSRKDETVDQAFSQVAHEYDEWVRQAIPTYDEMFRVAVEGIPHAEGSPLKVLDLGAGSGLFSQHVLKVYTGSSLTLVDLSEEMLDEARKRFAWMSERMRCIKQSLEEFEPSENYDLVISSLAIHHMEHDDKRRLFERIYAALVPGGAFVNVDQVRGDGSFAELYWATWLKRTRESGAPEENIQKSIQRRRKFDRDASLAEQLDWLSTVGFKADCLYKHYFMAVFLAVRPLQ